ncbi:MAG TPA: AraC family transcriptional regulator [Thermoanaerobaculaceae bacterium]|nr:AraC family transcriptional regulator [Thermoanaerobaculaceae bacterium]
MPDPLGRPFAARPLHATSLVRMRDYVCSAAPGGPTDEERSAAHEIVLMRHGAFCKHLGRRRALVDVNEVAFFERDSTYRVSHPGSSGDRGTVFAVAPRVLNEIVREYHPGVDDHPDHPFPFHAGPCDPTTFWRHRALVQRLELSLTGSAPPPEPLWVDTTALQLMADVLGAAFARQGIQRALPRAGTVADHQERVELAKAYLAVHLDERITLDEVATAVHASPFHFARMFQRYTGVSLHRYLMRLRLRAALERLGDPRGDLTDLALDLGFSSHSHFTDAFRREFGHPPSDLRRAANGLERSSGSA